MDRVQDGNARLEAILQAVGKSQPSSPALTSAAAVAQHDEISACSDAALGPARETAHGRGPRSESVTTDASAAAAASSSSAAAAACCWPRPTTALARAPSPSLAALDTASASALTASRLPWRPTSRRLCGARPPIGSPGTHCLRHGDPMHAQK
jgi:hypothetical protein